MDVPFYIGLQICTRTYEKTLPFDDLLKLGNSGIQSGS